MRHIEIEKESNISRRYTRKRTSRRQSIERQKAQKSRDPVG